MAIEGVTGESTPVVESGQPTPTSTQTTQTPPLGTTGSTQTPDHQKAWDTERQGFLRDLQAERKARQQYEQQYGTTKAELEQERKRIQALVGVNTPSAEVQEEELIRANFSKLYPHLGGLTAEDITALRELRDSKSQMEAATSAMWRDKARLMSTAVEGHIAKELGGELTPRQISRIRAAYVQAAEASPEFLARHEAGDLKLAEEFAKEFLEDWFEPAKRKATQQQISQFRRVPSGKDRSTVGTAAPKIDINDSKAVEDFLVAGRKERGQQFGRR